MPSDTDFLRPPFSHGNGPCLTVDSPKKKCRINPSQAYLTPPGLYCFSFLHLMWRPPEYFGLSIAPHTFSYAASDGDQSISGSLLINCRIEFSECKSRCTFTILAFPHSRVRMKEALSIFSLDSGGGSRIQSPILAGRSNLV